MDRRKLLKLTGTYGVGATFLTPGQVLAADDCVEIIIENGDFGADPAGATLQFWIDGMHFGSRTDLPSRANITLWMGLDQSANSYVESVVLMDENSNTIAARYFDSSMKMIKGAYVPYVTFENIELDSEKTYHTVYSVKNGTNSTLYYATIENPEVSRLNTTWLPQNGNDFDMRGDFKNFLIGGEGDLPGLITTQFQLYTKNSLSDHTARGKMKDMSSNGDFTVNIEFMHGDTQQKDANGNFTHFMRYFIVMDPVGRLLGFHRRTHGEGGITNGTWDVSKITQQQKDDWNINETQIADIRDCPYIQFYTEDSYDAIARNIIRFR